MKACCGSHYVEAPSWDKSNEYPYVFIEKYQDLIHHHKIVAGYYGIMLAVRVSICRASIPLFVFSFPDDNLSKCQWIFTEPSLCIDIVEIWFGIVNGQIS